jgi:hypothetical protein
MVFFALSARVTNTNSDFNLAVWKLCVCVCVRVRECVCARARVCVRVCFTKFRCNHLSNVLRFHANTRLIDTQTNRHTNRYTQIETCTKILHPMPILQNLGRKVTHKTVTLQRQRLVGNGLPDTQTTDTTGQRTLCVCTPHKIRHW